MAMIKWQAYVPGLADLTIEARTRDEVRRQFYLWMAPMTPRYDENDNERPYTRTEFESEYGSELQIDKLGRA